MIVFTHEEVLEIARSVLQGKPTANYPAAAEPFSYVRAANLLSQYLLFREQEAAHELDVA